MDWIDATGGNNLDLIGGRGFPGEACSGEWLREGIVCPWFGGQVVIGRRLKSRRAVPDPNAWSFYAPDFFLEEPAPWWIFHDVELIQRSELGLRGQMIDRVNTFPNWSYPPAETFYSMFWEIKSLLAQKRLEKLVPVVVAQQEGRPDPDVISYLLRRMSNTEGPVGQLFPYGFWLGDEGMMGMTPELLVEGRGGFLRSMALAGTRRSHFPCGDLLNDPKEKREHQLVVDAIVQQLREMGEVQVNPTWEWNLGRLTHLRTDLGMEIGTELKTIPCLEWIQRLHPTPALGAWPKEGGLHWLKKHRPPEARRFGAPFGVRSPNGEFLFVVAIRNIQWHDGRAWLATGCGVIEESQAEREWEELILKREFILETLGL